MPIYAGMEDSLAVIRRENGSWQLDTRLEGKHAQCVAADPLRPEHVLCGTLDAGLWHSWDAGETWQPAGTGIAQAMVMAVAANPLEPAGDGSVLYAGTEPSALYRSEDGGATWRERPALLDLPSRARWSFPPRPYTSHVRWITPDPIEAGMLYVCIEAGALVRSLDSGQTWIDRTPDGPWDTHTLAAHPKAPGRLYSAAGDGFMAPGNGYCESRDRAASWQRPDEGLQHHYLWSVAVDPGNPDTVLVSAARGPREAHDTPTAESYLYYRLPGQPWAQATDGLPEPRGTGIWAVAVNPDEPGVFYAVSNRGLYRHTSDRAAWARLDVAWPERYAQQHVGGIAVTGP